MSAADNWPHGVGIPDEDGDSVDWETHVEDDDDTDAAAHVTALSLFRALLTPLLWCARFADLFDYCAARYFHRRAQ